MLVEQILQIFGTVVAFFTMLIQAPIILFTDNPPTREQLESARVHEEAKQKLLEKKQKELKIGAAEPEREQRTREKGQGGEEGAAKEPRERKPKESAEDEPA